MSTAVGSSSAVRAVTLVETGMGNVKSVARALERAGASVRTSGEPSVIAASDRIVVPGQGHFGDGARALRGALGEAIREHLARERPYLGICLGMQLLFDASEEAPGERGLAVFAGTVRRFAPGVKLVDGRPRKVPHMGWNLVRPAEPSRSVAGSSSGSGSSASSCPSSPSSSSSRVVEDDSWLYFVHSYHCVPADPSLVAAQTDYGEPVCAAIARGSLFACQFHPEKSGPAGEAILRRFLDVGAA